MVGTFSYMQIVEFILRWLHLFFGVLWIGHLYYFNFTQGVFLNDPEVDASAKMALRRKLLPVALFYFRWGAMWTLVTGLVYYAFLGHLIGSFSVFLTSGHGWTITVGAILGVTMWYNVWYVIWPNQKLVIQNAEGLAKGQPPLPEAGPAGIRANVASRTNTLLSIPVLFFMTTSRFLPLPVDPERTNFMLFWVLFGILWLAIEVNALKGQTYKVMTTVKQVIHSGFLLGIILIGMLLATV